MKRIHAIAVIALVIAGGSFNADAAPNKAVVECANRFYDIMAQSLTSEGRPVDSSPAARAQTLQIGQEACQHAFVDGMKAGVLKINMTRTQYEEATLKNELLSDSDYTDESFVKYARQIVSNAGAAWEAGYQAGAQ